MTDWTEYLYRWHVIAIHFPIALLITAAIIETFTIIGRTRRSPQVTFSFALVTFIMTAFGAIGAVLAAWLGWKLAEQTKHPGMEQVLNLHRWGGVIAAVLAFLSAGVGIAVVRAPVSPLRRWPYFFLILLTAAAIILTAHWGGQLIYGEDYFFPPS